MTTFRPKKWFCKIIANNPLTASSIAVGRLNIKKKNITNSPSNGSKSHWGVANGPSSPSLGIPLTIKRHRVESGQAAFPTPYRTQAQARDFLQQSKDTRQDRVNSGFLFLNWAWVPAGCLGFDRVRAGVRLGPMLFKAFWTHLSKHVRNLVLRWFVTNFM